MINVLGLFLSFCNDQNIVKFDIPTGRPETSMPRLCGYCGAALDSIISVFAQLHRSGFNLEFETLFDMSQYTRLLIYGREKSK